MGESLEESYLKWLSEQCYPADEPENYDKVLEALHEEYYVVNTAMDENRVHDATGMREEFETDIGAQLELPQDQVTILEVLVALARRAEFQTAHISAAAWVRIFLLNADILFRDEDYNAAADINVGHVIDLINMGGYQNILPLDNPRPGTRTELWLWLMDYIVENDLE